MSPSRDLASARGVAGRLLGREPPNTLGAVASGEAMERAVRRVLDDLKGAVGADGVDALVDRAIRQTATKHPALSLMHGAGAAGARLDIGAVVNTHGVQVTYAALEALVATLVDTLSALIGADMTRNLLHLGDS